MTLVIGAIVHILLQSIKSDLPVSGALIEASPSLRGEIKIQTNQLRDPHIFEDVDGSLYLLHVGGVEQALGIQKIDNIITTI